MTWEEVKDLGPLYALGALDHETARRVEDFLRSATPEQQREIVEWREVSALIPLSLPSTPVPETIKDRLMARIAAEQTGRINEDLRNSPADQSATVLPFASKRAKPSTARRLLIAASVLLALTSGYLFWKNLQLEVERNKLALELDRIQGEYNNVVSPTTEVIKMVGDEAPQASAKLVWDKKLQTWVIYIYNLPAPPTDKDYQLWYVTKDASKISAEVFRPDPKGGKKLELKLPPEIANGLAATAVTLEPKGGSGQPTGKFYLKAAI